MTGISKKVYITKLDKLVKKCNNTYYETIKTKLVDVQQDISKYNKDIFWKAALQTGPKKYLWSKKWKEKYHGRLLSVILTV